MINTCQISEIQYQLSSKLTKNRQMDIYIDTKFVEKIHQDGSNIEDVGSVSINEPEVNSNKK